MADLRQLAYSISFDVDNDPIQEADGMADGLASNVTDAYGGMEGFSSSTLSAGGAMKGLVKAAAGLFALDKIKDFGMKTTETFANFEQNMANVRATIGDLSDKDFEKLNNTAKTAGREIGLFAADSADALNYMALAGFNVDESIGALPSVLTLSKAGGMDLAQTSDMVTDSMTALGLTVDDLSSLTDQMAKTSQKSNTEIDQLGSAILTVGKVAADAGFDTVELNAQLGILADSGSKGAQGGTELRNVLMNLLTPNEKVSKLLKELNVQTTDAEGNFLPLNTVLLDLKDNMGDFTQSQQAAIRGMIAGKENSKALGILLAGAGERYEELTGFIEDSDGAAKEMADTQNNTLKGALQGLKVEMEAVMIGIGENTDMSKNFSGVLNLLSDNAYILQDVVVGSFNAISKGMQFMLPYAQQVSDAFMDNIYPIAEDVFNYISKDALPFLQETFEYVFPLIADVVSTTFELIGMLYQNIIKPVLSAFGPLVERMASAFTHQFGGMIKIAQGFAEFLIGVFSLDSTKALDGLKTVFSGFGDFILGIFENVVAGIKDLPSAIGNAAKGIAKKIPGISYFFGEDEENPTPKADGIEMNADGTNYSADTFIAGEEGPELVTGARGSKVYTANETSSMLGKGNNITNNITINIEGGGDSSDIAQKVRDVIEDFFADLETQLI